MKRLISGIVSSLVMVTLVGGQMDAHEQRAITVEDCVRTRRVVDQEVAVSPDGTRVAYVVKAPNLATNRNDYRLYVRGLRDLARRENGQLLLQAQGISGIRWLRSDAIMARVENKSPNSKSLKTELEIVNAATGSSQSLGYSGPIKQYSATADGNTVVFSVGAREDDGSAARDSQQQKVRNERGFAISFGEGGDGTVDHLPDDAIYLARRTKTGKLELRKLYFNEPGGPQHQPFLRAVTRLDLSPDGKHLLVTYSARSLPLGWVDEPYVRYTESWGTFFYSYVLGLYEIETGRLSLGFDFNGFSLQTSWSQDSRSYSVVAPSPFGTEDERTAAEGAARSGDLDQLMKRPQHVFVVDVVSGQAASVLRRENGEQRKDPPLFWKHSDGPMLVRASDTAFVWMVRQEGKWRETNRLDIREGDNFLSSFASDGRVLVGVSQTAMDPPNLFAMDQRSREWTLLTDLNPEYRDIQLGRIERLEWTNRYGSSCAGLVIEPLGYETGKRYPMVFLSAPSGDVFVSDTPYTTAYAPQSLASAGFVVVIAQYPLDDKIPKGAFPGEMREAYNWMAMVEGAVDLLAARGMVDATNIGLGGFSRTSWMTDFTLTHSSYHFVAASSADSGIYTYGTYFTYNSRGLMKGFEAELGGPPYGETFKNWQEYTAPFNADKVRAAVLMEYTGTAEDAFEFFTALSRLRKPVELYRYPNGSHPLDTPFDRVASLQRNVDWFRFWMQGYVGTAPDYDASEYDRWRSLRSHREAGGGGAPETPHPFDRCHRSGGL